MSLLIGFLTFILVVNCLFLMLLVLVQLPKKEAGAGLAFGAGAVDTLIGAGSGNALTKLTKYAAGTFLGLAVLLAVLNAQRHTAPSRSLQQELQRKAASAPAVVPNQPAKAPVTGQLTDNVPATTPSAAATTPATATPTTQTNGPVLQLNPNAAAPTSPAPAQPK